MKYILLSIALALTIACTEQAKLSSSANELIDERDGKKYKIVEIGTQTWMAENLNFAVSGSICYDNKQENCDKYGRLYDWHAAMEVCPKGWRLPNVDEWKILDKYIGDDSIAGAKLKAKNGWNDNEDISGNGTDNYGFSALPGGVLHTKFSKIGEAGYWWNSKKGEGSGYASYRYMEYKSDKARIYSEFDSRGLSVRCLKESAANSIKSFKPNMTTDKAATELIDERDGKKYKIVQINEQIWMAENLNYNADSSACYDNKPENCDKYGRLYNWETAMNACPNDWRLPRQIDWNILVLIIEDSLNTGKKLKAMSGWKINGNGTDNYGFSALPGGLQDGNYFGYAGYNGFWWFADETEKLYASNLIIGNYANEAERDSYNKSNGFSVRCLKNTLANAATAKPVKFDSATIANHAKIAAEQAKLDSIEAFFIDSRDGKKYRTIWVDNEIWMAENLKYKAKGSKCRNDKPENCDRYGRLYNWHTARFNACPKGWHLPSESEWRSIDSENDSKKKRNHTNNDEKKKNANNPKIEKQDSFWWTSYTSDGRGTKSKDPILARIWGSNSVYDHYQYGNNFFNVICKKDYSKEYIMQKAADEVAKKAKWKAEDNKKEAKYNSKMAALRSVAEQTRANLKSFTDKRDGKTYKISKIGTQTWMAENLNYETSEGSICYAYTASYCDKYGRLYDWATAMALPSYCNSTSCASQIQLKHRGICPAGYHIPSNAEWETLMNYAGGEKKAAKKLKATSGWYYFDFDKTPGNGEDTYGFSALPGGMYKYGGTFSSGYMENGYWWTSTERKNSNSYANSRTNAYYKFMNYYVEELVWYDDYFSRFWDTNYKDSGLSVRCLKD